MSKAYREKKRLFYKRIKEIQEAHKPSKVEARKPYNWKKEWGPFIKYDADWDGGYFLDLVIYKLEKMYAELDIFSNEYKPNLDKKLEVLKKTIELGKKIQTFDYGEEDHKFSKEHTQHYILIYKHEGARTVGEGKIKFLAWDKEELLYKMPTPEMTVEEENKTRNWMGSETAYKWAEENGYDRKDIHLAYGAEWDDPANYDKWLEIMEEENKAKQKDKDDFFLLISRNYRDWWW